MCLILNSAKKHTGAIVGAVLGVLGAIVLAAGLLIFRWRKKQQAKRRNLSPFLQGAKVMDVEGGNDSAVATGV